MTPTTERPLQMKVNDEEHSRTTDYLQKMEHQQQMKKVTTVESGANRTQQILTHMKKLMIFIGYGGDLTYGQRF